MESAVCYKFPHGRMGRPCETCPRIKESTTFSSSKTKMRYKMRHRLHCKSSWIIYLITCVRPCDRGLGQSETGERICGMQYCGSSTETMAGRHAGHRTDIKNSSSPLGRHFKQCGIKNLSLQIIDTVKEGQLDALEQLEGHWTHRLATFQVHGHINVRNEMGKRRNRN